LSSKFIKEGGGNRAVLEKNARPKGETSKKKRFVQGRKKPTTENG